MPDEKGKATITRIRGEQAAKMPHADAKQYVADTAKIDKNYSGVELQTDLTARKQQSSKVMGSFQKGGTVPATGNYKLHAGEKVVPKKSTALYKKASDPTPFAGVTISPSGTDDMEYGGAIKQRAAATRSAHETAVAAGGFEKHGMVIPDESKGPHSNYHRKGGKS